MAASRKHTTIVILMAFIAIGLASCRSPMGGELGEGATGSLRILLPSSGGAAGAKGVLQGLVGTVASWRVTGDGPGSATCDIPVMASGGTITVELLIGDWELTLTGLDADGSAVMSSSMPVTVEKTDTPKPTAFTMAWTDKALVARLSFDEAIEDDKGRVTPTLSGSGLALTPSAAGAPTIDGNKCLDFSSSAYLDMSTIELDTKFSISLWIKTTGTSDMVLASSRQSSDGDGFTLYRGGTGTI